MELVEGETKLVGADNRYPVSGGAALANTASHECLPTTPYKSRTLSSSSSTGLQSTTGASPLFTPVPPGSADATDSTDAITTTALVSPTHGQLPSAMGSVNSAVSEEPVFRPWNHAVSTSTPSSVDELSQYKVQLLRYQQYLDLQRGKPVGATKSEGNLSSPNNTAALPPPTPMSTDTLPFMMSTESMPETSFRSLGMTTFGSASMPLGTIQHPHVRGGSSSWMYGLNQARGQLVQQRHSISEDLSAFPIAEDEIAEILRSIR